MNPSPNPDTTAPFSVHIEHREDKGFRPARFEEFIGQTRNVENLKIFIKAALQRKEPLDHVLLSGPPGLGKTTLAHIIANEMRTHIRATSAPAIEKAGDLASMLTALQPRDILFIDEIHRMPTQIEEILYPALEDRQIDLVIGQGPTAKSIKIPIKPFTLVGATTRPGLLSSPLTARFGIPLRLEYYNIAEMASIVERNLHLLEIDMDPDAIDEIARRGRSTPRIVIRLLRRIRDFAQVRGEKKITLERTRYALDAMQIDNLGLDPMDRKILGTIIEYYNGGPVGLKTIATAVGEDIGTIEDIYEPFLIQSGFLNRTSRGRITTHLAYQHLGYEKHSTGPEQASLF